MRKSGGIAALASGYLSACAVTLPQPPLALDVLGHGQPVIVLESGLGQDRKHWLPVAKALARCMTVVIYDRAGNGDSSPLKAPSQPIMAGDVASALLLQLRMRDIGGPFILVGHSIGGLYVQAFARNYRQKLQASSWSMRQAR